MSSDMTSNSQRKTAVDSTAEKYWSEYYGEYGQLWVRKIPMRVKAALAEHASQKKLAAVQGEPTIAPLATVITDDGVTLEGVAVWPNALRKAFVIEFSHEGAVKSGSFEVVDVG